MRIKDSKRKVAMLIRKIAIISQKLDLTINCQIIYDKGKDGGKFCGIFSCKYMEGLMYLYSRDASTWDEAVRDFGILLHVVCAVYELTLTDEISPFPPGLEYLKDMIPEWVRILRSYNPAKYDAMLVKERARHMQRN